MSFLKICLNWTILNYFEFIGNRYSTNGKVDITGIQKSVEQPAAGAAWTRSDVIKIF
jgi:hypothetical protein